MKIAKINPLDQRVFVYFKNTKKIPPKEILKLQYDKKPAKDLAEMYGLDLTSFYKLLKNYDIKVKGRGEAMRQYRLKGKQEPKKETVEALIKKGLSIPKIAETLGFSKCYIRNFIKRYGINYKSKTNIKRFKRTGNREKVKIKKGKLTDKVKAEPKILEIDYESYKNLEYLANLDCRDMDVVKGIIKAYVSEIYEDISNRTSRAQMGVGNKNIAAKIICSSILKTAKEMGYSLVEINTNNEFQLKLITMYFLSNIKKEFDMIRKTYSIAKKDRIKYIKSKLTEHKINSTELKKITLDDF